MDRFLAKALSVTALSLTIGLSSLAVPAGAHAAAIVSGFNTNTLARNDDGSDGPVNIGFTANFFGIEHNELYVNNNGNVTFGSDLSTFTPFDLTSTGQQIIAPFFSDVDTRSAGEPVTYGTGMYEGRDAFGVNWIDVDYYPSNTAHTNRNSFQLILVDRSDIASGDFDFIFNYDQIEWEAGTASGSDPDGLGGSSARVGYSNGTGDPGTFFELSGSAVNGAFIDGGPNALISSRLNSDVDGRYVFSARSGGVDNPVQVPEPGSLALLGIGLAGLGFVRRRRTL
ncbi:nidogen-like domain-containing protein [Marinobacter sp. SS13-12]|uniref:nidogen-like domain-containing protein n=1 Tax=Marinobacter sp. SS13-12 TaxID=3050451 RepID=UPI002557BA81|nr:nidogen-like domain-containing protein [Marinobacter sp. SS13-12]MDK8464216.1 nidogen-like domain-containing protein [Marinobacter sp. SS13-12]